MCMCACYVLLLFLPQKRKITDKDTVLADRGCQLVCCHVMHAFLCLQHCIVRSMSCGLYNAVLPTGRLPYHRLSNLDAMRAVHSGTKLVKPDGCNPEL